MFTEKEMDFISKVRDGEDYYPPEVYDTSRSEAFREKLKVAIDLQAFTVRNFLAQLDRI